MTIRSLATVVVAAIAAVGCVPVADDPRPEPLPIVDFHAHLNGDMEAERLLGLMGRAGVRSMVLMARYYANSEAGGYGTDRQAADFAARHQGRFIPFVAGQRGQLGAASIWENVESAAWYLRDAETNLRSGRFFGLGEYILNHHAYSMANVGQGGGEVRVPAYSPLMNRLSALGENYGVPVLFHLEAEPEPTEQAIRLLEANPDTIFVWAHNCGRASADQIRRLLRRFRGLMCDLGGMMATPGNPGGYGRYWPKRTPHIHLVQGDDGTVDPEMLRLFEDFSGRFLLGTDPAHTPALLSYEKRIYAFRQMLSQMSPTTAKRIAHENAERVLALRRIP